MAKDVMCTVENCHYWDKRHCTASAIEVNVDGGGQKANYTGETNCHTFVEKGAARQHLQTYLDLLLNSTDVSLLDATEKNCPL